MSRSSRNWTARLAALTWPALAGLLIAVSATAQVVPNGNHYGGRSSDTGFAGAVNSQGGYSQSVPLDLPAARGGLPVPVQIVNGSSRFGAAGLGWDVPLSFIRRDLSITHRRPAGDANITPSERERLSLSLNGESIDLVRSASDTAWVARRGNAQLEVREQQDGSWLVFDGNGLKYNFPAHIEDVEASAEARLHAAGLWLLQDITGPGGSLVRLSYTIRSSAFSVRARMNFDNPPTATGVSIDLDRVSYNPLPSDSNCYKHQVVLHYDEAAPIALALSMLDASTALVRQHKLVSVDVASNATCGASGVVLRTYLLGYLADSDTDQPRLQSVTMIGQEGTPERNVTLPIATYTYGSVTDGSTLPYGFAYKVPIPTGLFVTEDVGRAFIGPTSLSSNVRVAPLVPEYATQNRSSGTTQALLDFTGDGRPEFVHGVADGVMGFINEADQSDKTRFLGDMRLIGGSSINGSAVVPNFSTAPRALESKSHGIPDANGRSIDFLWRQVIDVNGDGRLDIIDARETTGAWVVYLNTPQDSSGIVRWERRTVLTGEIATRLQLHGYSINRDYVPLEMSKGDKFKWKLADINGDGYPDFLFESDLTLNANSTVQAMFNVAGMGIDQNTNLFSSPVIIVPAAIMNTAVSRCGLGGHGQDCDLVDVNGDGLPDRAAIISSNGEEGVFLNTGQLEQLFTASPMLQSGDFFGGFLTGGVYSSSACIGGKIRVSRFSEPRDINGDGIGDMFTDHNTFIPGRDIRFGTGRGFGPPRTIAAIGLVSYAESLALDDCPNGFSTASATAAGAFDLDGDGQPEIVAPDFGQLDVYKLNAPNHLAAGRLIRVDYGHGAVTAISYRSAKGVLGGGRHVVPFPEIVVSSVGTVDASDETLINPVSYAYTGASLQFDPAYDRWVFPGYRRSVELRKVSIAPTGFTEGVATITDTYGLAAFDPNMDPAARFKRYLKAGRISDVTTLSGSVGTDPWASSVLFADIDADPRRISATYFDWDTRRLAPKASPLGPQFCLDMSSPYDFLASGLDDLFHGIPDQCMEHGFVFQKSVFSWRGEPGAADAVTSTRTVQTNSTVDAVDDFGRTNRATQDNDVARGDDDVCIFNVYAQPTGSNERMLNALAMRTVTACGGSAPTLAQESWEYDGLRTSDPVNDPAKVSKGFITGHTVSRRDAETGMPIVDANGSSDIRRFTATYDANGNPTIVTRMRDDGATQTSSIAYDLFGLVPTSVTTTATNAGGGALPAMTTGLTFDPITLNPLSTTDANGAVSSTTYDGFGRVRLSKVKPVGGTEGVLSTLTYNGFAAGQTGGRNIVQKAFTDPVPEANVGTAAGRTGTVFLDNLGRETKTEVALGADYANKKLVVGQRTYDQLGRVFFEADPYEATNPGDNYGTTAYFNTDGSPRCSIRGKGIQPLTDGAGKTVTVESTERYATCASQLFISSQELVATRDAESNRPGSTKDSNSIVSAYTAIGQLVSRGTFGEATEFAYDRLGQQISMTRYPDPQEGGRTDGVVARWHYDSLGQVTKQEEPGAPPQNRRYDSWGELTQVAWCDPTFSSCVNPGTINRSTITQYDALGRVTHRESRDNNSLDPGTVYDYTYDQPATFIGRIAPTNVLGRLASASWPAARVAFSYDGLGRVAARGFDNRHGNAYIEKHVYHGDGSRSELHLLLPDTGYKDEKVSYSYDSAGRTRSVKYNDGTNRDLFTADGSTDLDVFGRIRTAKYGTATYTASYADTGRRLLNSVQVASPAPLSTSRKIEFPVLAGIAPFDPLGRERARRESRDGTAQTFATLSNYDILDRLKASTKFDVATAATQADRAFTYDPLGNILTQTDAAGNHPGSVTLTYQTTDRDRLCSIGYGTVVPPTSCNVVHDGMGNVISEPTPNGTRTFSHYANGRVKQINLGSNRATFTYDAFGVVSTLDLTSTSSSDVRTDRHFGKLIELHKEEGQLVLTRAISAPGLTATRHGPAGGWTFVFGEGRGNRFVTDQNGVFAQDMTYQPYGEIIAWLSGGAAPGMTNYVSDQWNDGDSLQALGVAQLGARLYDPVIGRFLSRDPLFDRSNPNPYAFAANDPVNNSDPTGLCTDPQNPLCITNGGGEHQGGGNTGGNGCPGCNPDGTHGGGVHDVTPTHTRPGKSDRCTSSYDVTCEQPKESAFGPVLEKASPGSDPFVQAAGNALRAQQDLADNDKALYQKSSRVELGSDVLGAVLEEGAGLFNGNVATMFGNYGKFLGAASDLLAIGAAGHKFWRNPSIGTGAGVAYEGLKAGINKFGLPGHLVTKPLFVLEKAGLIGVDPATGAGVWSAEARANRRFEAWAEREGKYADWLRANKKYELELNYQLYSNDVCVEATTCEASPPPQYGPELAPSGSPWRR